LRDSLEFALRNLLLYSDKMLLRRVLNSVSVGAARCCYATSASPSKGRALERLQNYNPDWTESQREVRGAMAKLLEKFDDEYWLEVDRKARFPVECGA
jgi:hypothetical protein